MNLPSLALQASFVALSLLSGSGLRAQPAIASGPEKKLHAMTPAEARQFWSYQPVRVSELPKIRDASWARNEIDRFVLARLEHEKLTPNPPAEPRVLVRRLFFDLIGLPPTFAEMERFAANPSQDAFAKLVDDLLARPEYGQRWGRHWLDVARFSDTTEQSVDGERRIPFAHTYRDYVIEAFNSDKPFDRFILEQIAADRMPQEGNPDKRALGFLTVGRRFQGNADAPQLIIDDRIDVIGRGFLGLTLACARCHDHKFDAVPTADYYSLYGILASTEEPLDKPETKVVLESPEVAKYRGERAKILAEYEEHIVKTVEKSNRLLREMAPEYLRYLVESSPNHRTTEGFVPLDTPRGLLFRGGPARWAALLQQHRDGPYFKLWHQLIALKRGEFESQAKQIIANMTAEPGGHHPLVVKAFRDRVPKNMLEAADIFGQVITDSLKRESSSDPQLANLITRPSSPIPVNREEIAEDLLRFVTEYQLVPRPDGETAGKIRQKLTVLEATAPVERAMSLQVSAKPFEPRVLMRGELDRPGPLVPRRFLNVLAVADDRTYADDGRLALAQAVASPKNPLTARVIVNRVWQHHFGRGLAATPDDFGAMGERPTHPELLDHLASRFMEHGWSIKSLHRYILMSATWQQSSASRPAALERDPLNQLLWRISPRRLEFEPLRDGLLQAAGRLDTRLGGRSEPLTDQNLRRAVYGHTDRFRIPALLRNFDVANPDTSISKRAETIHPLQSLYFLNSAFVRDQAQAVLRHPEVVGAKNSNERIGAIYRRVFSRSPEAEELALSVEFLGNAALDETGTRRWASFVQSLFFCNEFAFVD